MLKKVIDDEVLQWTWVATQEKVINGGVAPDVPATWCLHGVEALI
jgi:hypothetical protein